MRAVPWWGVISAAAAPIVLIGGWTVAAGLQPRFDPVTDTWTQLTPLPVADSDMGAAYIGGQLITFGGENPLTVYPTVRAYNLASRTWSTLPNMAQPRHGMGVAVVGNTIYAIDGAKLPGHAGSTGTVQLLRFSTR